MVYMHSGLVIQMSLVEEYGNNPNLELFFMYEV